VTLRLVPPEPERERNLRARAAFNRALAQLAGEPPEVIVQVLDWIAVVAGRPAVLEKRP
jgi:hypothetical protein